MTDSTHTLPNSALQFSNSQTLSEEDQKKTGRVDDARKLDVNNLPDLLTVREVADLLRVSPLTIKRWGKRGKLPAIRINSRGDRRYKKEAVLYLLGMNVTEEDATE
jgi:excisionase family DNA binding protein